MAADPLDQQTVDAFPTSKCSIFATEVDEVLDIIGHPSAAVTDESTLWDFVGQDADAADKIAELNFKFDLKAKPTTKIWEIARRIEAANGMG